MQSFYSSECPYIYRGIVESNVDPRYLGRCKVRVPAIHGELTYSADLLPWARPIVPSPVSGGRSSINIPNIGDVVWVMFEGGNKQYPLYLGGSHSINDMPVNKDRVILYIEDGNKIVYDRIQKTYTLSVGSTGIVLHDGYISLIGDVRINGNLQVGGSIRASSAITEYAGVSVSEGIVAEEFSPDVAAPSGGSTTGGTTPGGSSNPSSALSADTKSLLVTGGIGVNRLADTESFCEGLLTTVSVKCRDESGATYTKRLTVNKYLADDVKSIFQEIYDTTTFCVRNADTGAYNYRKISGSSKLSYHSYGVAIDINWNLNPYSKLAGGSDDNLRIRTREHPVVRIFRNHGWGWGGSYSDFMHFSYFDGY